jgi:DNA repair photolyase
MENELKRPRNHTLKPIYMPSGRAHEYGEYAINIYTGCDNGCTYCYAPGVLHLPRTLFEMVQPREGIIEATRVQLSTFRERDKHIFLSFTCDPYPRYCDSTPTREIIKAIKLSGNHVMLLTKTPIERDFDLLDDNDWFGVTLTCDTDQARELEPKAYMPSQRLMLLNMAHNRGIKTWVSMEPVIDPNYCCHLIAVLDYIDLYKIGKLNHQKSDAVDWKHTGRNLECWCNTYHRNYYIKEDLRREMNRE